MVFTGRKLKEIHERLSRTLAAQGIEHGSGQRHCRITLTDSKMSMKDVEQKCYSIEMKDYEIATEIILDRKSSQNVPNRPLERKPLKPEMGS